MKDSIISNIKNLAKTFFYKSVSEIISLKTGKHPYLPEFVLSGKRQNFISDLCVKNIINYNLPSIDANELIIDSLETFHSPFKISLLVYDKNNVVGTLNLSDVIEIISTSVKINSSYCLNIPVSCIMDKVFISLDINTALSKILVDVLNSDSLIYPVYDKGCLKGVLHKDTILDIVKLQMLEEASLYN